LFPAAWKAISADENARENPRNHAGWDKEFPELLGKLRSDIP
jgi:hypothetical protein